MIKEILMAGGKRFLIVVSLILAAVFLMVDVSRAEAAGLTFSASTTISFTGDTWTIKPTSTADSVQVGASNIVVTLANGDSFTIHVNSKSFTATGQSANATVSNNPCYFDFGDHVGKLTITANQAETVTVASTTCSLYDFSEGTRNSTPTAITNATPTPTITTSPPLITPTAPSSTSAETLTSLPVGLTIADIQSALNEVAEKIANIQTNLNAPDVLNQINQLASQIADIQKAISGNAALPGGSTPPGGSYNQSLSQGSTGDDVTALQNFLKAQGADIYPEGLVTGFYGPLTREAVEQFQLKYGIITGENDPGAGYAGPRTREKINSLLGL